MQVNKRSLKSQNIVFRILCNFMLNCTKSRRTECGICKIDYVFEIDTTKIKLEIKTEVKVEKE